MPFALDFLSHSSPPCRFRHESGAAHRAGRPSPAQGMPAAVCRWDPRGSGPACEREVKGGERSGTRSRPCMRGGSCCDPKLEREAGYLCTHTLRHPPPAPPAHPLQTRQPPCPWTEVGSLLGASDPIHRRVVLATRNGLELRGVLMRCRSMRQLPAAGGVGGLGPAAGAEEREYEALFQHGEDLIV